MMLFCSGIVAEKTDNELFFVDKSAVTSNNGTTMSSEGGWVIVYCWSFDSLNIIFYSIILCIVGYAIVCVQRAKCK